MKASDSLVRELAEILGSLVDDQLTTKNDLDKLRLQIQAEVQKSKSETIKWIIGWIS